MTSYVSHFGLERPPFTTNAGGASIFVPPQVATVISGLKKALATEDAIVCLTGPVGAGKTTIAKRALEGIGENRGIVTIGRIQFGPDEVLELLLAGLGARQLPKSNVHRFATFRRLLLQFAEHKTRVFILVEDANRVGFDALSELEALTAADAGVSNGANLVLLGDSRLQDLLRDPKLARLKQRVRSRQTIGAQSMSEMTGYLKHCFRLAGKDFDDIFDAHCAASLHSFSDGLPRVLNNLIEAVLTAATEQGMTTISPSLIAKIASEECGLTAEHSIGDIAATIEKADSPAATAPDTAEESETVTDEQPVEIKAPAFEPLQLQSSVPAVPVADEDNDDDDFEIPELIQDTLPDLQILAPSPASTLAAPAAPKPEPEPVREPTENELPTLSYAAPEKPGAAELPAEARDENGKIPDWDRDPTLAELRPDLEALERAMAIAQGLEADPDADTNSSKAGVAPKAATPDEVEVVPEITLDKQIEAKIAEATEALKRTHVDATAEASDNAPAADEPELPVLTVPGQPAKSAAKPAAAKAAVSKSASAPAPVQAAARPPAAKIDIPKEPEVDPKKADQELAKIASQLAKAKTIEDVDDFLAETLFGEEFSMLAAQVAANAPPELLLEVAPGVPAGRSNGHAAASNDPVASPRIDTSSSQRLQVLRDLNGTPAPRGAPPSPEAAESIVMADGRVDDAPVSDVAPVDSIEDQIETSMTQTLKALNVRHTAAAGDDDDDDDDRKGFFSRFRRK